MRRTTPDSDKLDRVVAEAQANRLRRERGYREQALKLYPWVCGRCGREFDRSNVHELTVHHRDHDHDNNPPDGSNWELLCLYCHDYEHQKYGEAVRYGVPADQGGKRPAAGYKAFSGLAELLKAKGGKA